MLKKKEQALLLIFAFGILSLNYPLIGIANKQEWWMGIPVLYWYLLSVWSFLVLVLFLVMNKKQRNP